METVDRILMLIGGVLVLFIIVAFIIFSYYMFRYRNTNLFTDKGQRTIDEITDDEIIQKLNEYTLKFVSFRLEYFEKCIDKWRDEYLIIFFANIFRLSIEKGDLLEFFRNTTENNIMRIAKALTMIGQKELADMLPDTFDKCKKGEMGNQKQITTYMWYKYPLKTSVIKYIRLNAEKFN